MQMNPYLFFNGECAAAFKFYEQCLGGKIIAMMTYADSPMAAQTPAEQLNQIMHVQLKVGAMELMGSDTPAEYFEKPQGFYVNLQFDDMTEAKRIFQALAEDGTIRMAFEETFWAKGFGMLVDRFGTPWMVNCNLPV
jgi:PhnB protein